MNFLSDNTSGASPNILKAIVESNDGDQSPYGGDIWTKRAEAAIADVFGCDVAVFFVTTGTVSNALAVSAISPPSRAVFCHDNAHLIDSECGAPEFFTNGGKLVGIAGPAGKMDPQALASRLQQFPPDVARQVQPGALSISQATESGTVYRPSEIRSIADLAHDAGMSVHMDGARFANAVAALDTAPAEITWKAGIDVLSLGATKNGALACEAIVFFDMSKAADFAFRRKKGGQTLSKGRFLGAQMAAYLADDHWLDLARHANRAAERLAARLAEMPTVRLPWATEANVVFATLPRGMDAALRAAGARYHLWDAKCLLPADRPADDEVLVRFICSFGTADADIDRLTDLIRQYSA
ncbi:Low specificity L-threonine aldolase [Aminobacter sp. MSH1]|uniref:threonine aldolase family protein n=1 Tax=Aminobacter sp. MSH1 TaxID=374606 RepID=UPI000D3B98BF|nr:low specificity L-threonine aldolase [Aminobacter sp. MSH1]AWC22497.1 Low specificity L-threonine aldolase [Aminobacter sp. MSH1]